VTVAVHGLPVILSVAKNPAWNRGPNEILRYAQNDGVSPAPGPRLLIPYLWPLYFATCSRTNLTCGLPPPGTGEPISDSAM
jgi:hypothetical protein